MKLYTEEEVIALTKSAYTAGQNHNSFIFWQELKNITPIELPTDEEIDNRSHSEEQEWGFRYGAKWMRDKIQGGNK